MRTIALLAAAALAASVATAATPDPKMVERGKYLVTIMLCNDCHTPHVLGPNGPEPDLTRMLSGHPESEAVAPAPALGHGPWVWAGSGGMTAFSGPWGTSFTANLTPDAETGLGKWTYANFRDTIRTGKHMGRGRPVLPPMPIPMYKNFNDADLEAIFAYLQSIPAVKNRVPEPMAPAADVAMK